MGLPINEIIRWIVLFSKIGGKMAKMGGWRMDRMLGVIGGVLGLPVG